MTKREIEALGQHGGKADVDEYHANLSRDRGGEDYISDEEIRERLLATISRSHLSWDEAARGADAARLNRVFGAKNVKRYYAAYNRGAESRVEELTA